MGQSGLGIPLIARDTEPKRSGDYFILKVIQGYSRLLAWHDAGLSVIGPHLSPSLSSALSVLVSHGRALLTHVNMAASRSRLLIQLKQKRKDFSCQQFELRSQVFVWLAQTGHRLRCEPVIVPIKGKV